MKTVQRRVASAVSLILECSITAIVILLPFIWILRTIDIEWGWLHLQVSWNVRPFVALTIGLLLYAALTYVVRPTCSVFFRLRVIKKLLLGWVITCLTLVLVEGILTVVGFSNVSPPLIVKGLEEEYYDEQSPFAKDDDLLWRLNPGTTLHGQIINQLGFPEREVVVERKANTTRVICMGDSCAADGMPPYSTFLNQLLTQAPETKGWEAFNNAVHGYTVMQGRRLYKKTTRHLDPDIVTICYGWNDHWQYSCTDRVRMASRKSTMLERLHHGVQQKRLFQLIDSLVPKPQEEPALRQLRVPPMQYEQSLTSLVRDIQADGRMPVLMTAPRAESLHSSIVNQQNVPIEQIYARHDSYVTLTRKVAQQEQVPLIDLAAIVNNDPDRSSYFLQDGIHFNERGRPFIAQCIFDELLLLTPPLGIAHP